MDRIAMLIVGTLLGAALVSLLLRHRRSEGIEQGRAEIQPQIAQLEERLRQGAAELQREREQNTRLAAELEQGRIEAGRLAERCARIDPLQQQLEASLGKADRLESENRQQHARIGQLETQLAAERQQAEEKLALIRSAERELSDRFKNLANEILEEKSKRFVEQNQSNIGALLTPLREQLGEFRNKVEQTYEQEARERHSLKAQIEQLAQSNTRLGEEADSLVRALKGSNKAQGNWGEMLLEQVLESSGLRKGFEYEVQSSHTNEAGRRLQPDVVVHLPEDKHLIIDAKVSLLDYERHANAEGESERKQGLDGHLRSLRAHIKGLSERQYENLYGGRSPDFVLMFIPIEPAFMAATIADRTLFQEAWKQNVVLVSPSTLLAMLRTIASVWRQELRNRNAQEIAERGAALYDKLAGFAADFEKVGQRIQQAGESFHEARNKLAQGRGSVVRQAEMLRDLGVKPGKSLPQPLLELSESSTPPEGNRIVE